MINESYIIYTYISRLPSEEIEAKLDRPTLIMMREINHQQEEKIKWVKRLKLDWPDGDGNHQQIKT